MTPEHVEAIALPIDQHFWDPNAPEAFLVSNDQGRSALALRAHPDDPDRRSVVLRWSAVQYALMAAPNDEALHRHRLYDRGLRNLLWIGVVRDSELVTALQPMSYSAEPPQHYIVLTKEKVVEVVAGNLESLRAGGSTHVAALAGMSS